MGACLMHANVVVSALLTQIKMSGEEMINQSTRMQEYWDVTQ